MDKMNKLFQKKEKEGRKLSDNEKDAKMSVVGALQKFAAEEMGKKIGNAKKAPEDFLEAKKSDGLKDADEPKDPSSVQENDALGDYEDEESPEHEGSELADLSEDEIDAKLKELMALKAKLKA